MRRGFNIGFFLVVIAFGLYAYSRWHRSGASPPVAVPTGAVPSPNMPPRLATPSQSMDAGIIIARPAVRGPSVMQQIRASVKGNPAKAEALARQARQSDPNGPDADERDALLVDALINQEHIGAARSETYYYFEHHPNGRFAEHLSVMTGVHPPPAKTAH